MTLIDTTKTPIVWILGGPGSGKGTQCDKIIEKYGYTHLSTGDLLRAEVKSGSERGKNLLAIMERGELVPNEIVLALLKEAIKAAVDANGFLIDGYPREKSQGLAFEKAIAPANVIIYFEASSETLTERLLGRALSSGRADDNEDTIRLRLKTFLENNDQVLAQYPHILRRINAEQSVDAIFKEVESILDPLSKKKEPIDTTKTPIVWILGGPGSGKGTQCDKIIEKYGYTHLSTGDLLRAEVKSGSERGKNLTAIMERGELVPNEIVLSLLREAIEGTVDANGFLIDGYPREKSQGLAFERAIAPANVIIYFEASSETLTERLLGRALSSGRADDNEDTIRLRLKTFLENNDQVLAQYPHKLRRINAEQPVDAIFREVEKILDPLSKKKIHISKAPIDTSKTPIVWILGGPGSGKGTQCDKIIEKYGYTHLSTGDLLRAEVKSGSERGKNLTAIMERGELVPNEIVLALLKEAIEAAADANGFLIDGYPREKSQGLAFEKTIGPATVIIYFEASSETLTKRLLGRALSSGRADDNEDTIRLRLKTFLENNDQVLAQYPHILRRINAEQPVNAIFREVESILDPLSKKKIHISKAPVDTSKKPIVWILGGPGSGKGTQCDKIIEKYGYTHLSTGDLLRAEVKSGSERGKNLTAIMERGELVPNEIVLTLLKEAIEAAVDANGFLIDGYPREKSQGLAFEKIIGPASVIIYFEASSETLTKRLLGRALSSGRADDNEDTIRLRLKTFLENNDQVLAQYPHILRRINAEQPVDAIFREVERILDPLSKKKIHISKAPIDTSKKPIVWILGGPGSGKGTQCDKIIEKYGYTHLSTGDLLRAEVKSGSERGKNLTAIMERGELVPNEIVLTLLKEAIEAAVDANGFLIDGYPREKSQGLAFEKTIGPASVIIYFEASSETLTKRLLGRALSSGRADDNEDTIRLRLKTFLENNDQVLAQYPHILRRINAEQPVDAIFREVERVLDPLSKKKIHISKAPIDTSKKPIVWILGGPGSGKGTQCDKIIEKYGYTHLSTGDLLRAEVKSGSERGKNLTAIMERGELVPNEIVLALLKEAIKAAADANGFLIDGYPREKSQGLAFEKTIGPATVIIYFEASSETLTKRLLGRALSSGRADDNEDTIRLRLKTFLENNDQVLAQYPHILRRINAEQPVDAIFKEVERVLDPLSKKKTFHISKAPIDKSKKPIVWILGGPGSGKGTQCDKIIEKYGYTHLSTGDLLRAEVKSGSERGKNLTAIMERGELVPNEIVLALLKEAIKAAVDANGFLIDGYPREKSQGLAFEKTIGPASVIIYFEASSETLTKRLLGRALSSGRADDNEDTIRLRLKTFLENNDQVLAQYPHILRRINAEKPVDVIFKEVESVLDPLTA